jgi:hypothetical protein
MKGGGKDDRNAYRNCDKKGHGAKDCRMPCKEQANLTEEKDEDSLLMAQVSEIIVDPAPPLSGSLNLNELTVHAYLCSSGSDEHMEGWYLDTGVSSHITGREEAFSLLNRVVGGTVRFGDGSRVPIQGHGDMVFTSMTGEKIKLVGVLFIPRLMNMVVG